MKTALILLAAGDSRRFGGNKLLYEFHGKPMYRYLVEEIGRLPEDFFERKLVVTQYEEIGKDLGACGYEVIENHESRLGISHSIHLALNALITSEDLSACCFAVCDQPYLKAESVRGLVEGFLGSGKGLGCLCHGEELGNPAVFSPQYREELLHLEGDAGGKKVIRRHLEDLFRYEAGDGRELADIDVRQEKFKKA